VAHSLSAQKRIRQNAKRNLRNRSRRSNLKTAVRKVADALAHRDAAATEKALAAAIKVLDREATRGTLHRNAAARRKSRLTKRLNALKAAAKA
jgi:small subunit ribosomal protein S20